MSDYKNKYLKYKNKYLKLKGGVSYLTKPIDVIVQTTTGAIKGPIEGALKPFGYKDEQTKEIEHLKAEREKIKEYIWQEKFKFLKEFRNSEKIS